MKALTLSHYGDPSTLELRDWPDPLPTADEERIAFARPASTHRLKLIRGDLKRIQPVRFPWIPALDLAGEVKAIAHSMQGRARAEVVVEGLAQ